MFRYKTLLRPKPLIFGLLSATVANGFLYADTQSQRYPHNLNAVLDHYGFRTYEQKQALRYLMQKAGVKNADALLVRKAKSPDELTRSILTFVKETQDNFAIRTGDKERWDVETSDWMKDPKQQAEIFSALETLKMMEAAPPTFKRPGAICVLGATRNIMASRLNYAGELVLAKKLSAQWLIMLAGERYVTPDKNGIQIDGSEQALSALAAKIGKQVSMLTETDLMKAEYEASKLYGKFQNRDLLIDTPRGFLSRPTTETTVTALCKWLRHHSEVQEITFVSNQPHVEYQKAIIEQVFEKQNLTIKCEAVGPEFDATLVVNNDEDKINYMMQALGNRIWATTPKVLDVIGLDIPEPKLREEYMALYKKQPLIYNNLEAKLPKLR